jgi:dynein heavy chain
MCNVSQRAEYSALLHNVTFLHCVLICRLRFGTVGFSCSYPWSEADRLEVLEFVYNEFALRPDPRVATVRTFMIAIYGRTTQHTRDRTILTALCDSWLSAAALKPGYEFKFPAAGPATSTLHILPHTLQRKTETKWVTHTPRHIEIAETVKFLAQSPHLHEESLAELCGLNIGTRCDTMIDRSVHRKVKRMVRELAPTNTLSSDLHGSADTVATPPEFTLEGFADEIEAIRKRIPKHVVRGEAKGFRKTAVVFNSTRRSSAVGRGAGAVARFVRTEVLLMSKLLTFVRQDLLTMAAAYAGTAMMTPATHASIESIRRHRLPRAWEVMSWGPRTSHAPLTTWIEDLQVRVKELEKLHRLGTRISSVYLGGLFNPRGFLGALQQEAALPSHPKPVLKIELTAREKDHLREPPVEGVFVHNISLEGGTWFGGTLRDTVTPSKRQMLPVFHLTFSQTHEQPGRTNGVSSSTSGPIKNAKTQFDARPEQPTVNCPVYLTPRRCADDDLGHIFSVEMPCETAASAAKFVARGVAASLRR